MPSPQRSCCPPPPALTKHSPCMPGLCRCHRARGCGRPPPTSRNWELADTQASRRPRVPRVTALHIYLTLTMSRAPCQSLPRGTPTHLRVTSRGRVSPDAHVKDEPHRAQASCSIHSDQALSGGSWGLGPEPELLCIPVGPSRERPGSQDGDQVLRSPKAEGGKESHPPKVSAIPPQRTLSGQS